MLRVKTGGNNIWSDIILHPWMWWNQMCNGMPSGHKVKTGVNPERRGAKVKSQADNMHQQREKQDSNMGKNPKLNRFTWSQTQRGLRIHHLGEQSNIYRTTTGEIWHRTKGTEAEGFQDIIQYNSLNPQNRNGQKKRKTDSKGIHFSSVTDPLF